MGKHLVVEDRRRVAEYLFDLGHSKIVNNCFISSTLSLVEPA